MSGRARELGSEALIRCGGCGHSRQEHRDSVSCIIPMCTCTEYRSMDRVLPHGADFEAIQFPVRDVMTSSPIALGTENACCDATSNVAGESTCR